MTQSNVIELIIKIKNEAAAQLTKLQGGIKTLASQVFSLKSAFAAVGVGLVFRKFLNETINAQRAAARLDAAYSNMGKTVGVTREQMDALATQMQRNTVIDDDTVKSAEAILLTFSKVRGEAFGKTIQVAADLSSRMGTDLVGSVRLLGRALEDPVRGMNGLRRAGLVFTAQQKDLIRSLSETGKTGEAINVMLDILAGKLGGSAAREAATLGGAIEQLKNSFGDLFEQEQASTKAAVDSIHEMRDALEDPRFKAAFDTLATGFVSIGASALRGISWAAGQISRVFENTEQQFERLNRNVEAAKKSGDKAVLADAMMARGKFVAKQEAAAKKTPDENDDARAREMRAFIEGKIQRAPDKSAGGAVTGAGVEQAPVAPELTEEQIKGLRQLREELGKQKDVLELQATGADVSAAAMNNLSVKAALAKLNLTALDPAAAGVAKALADLNEASVRAAIGTLSNQYGKEREALEAQREALQGNATALDDLAVRQAMASAGITDLTKLTDTQRVAYERLLATLREMQVARESLTVDQAVKGIEQETAALELQAQAGWRAADAIAALQQEQQLRDQGVNDPAQIARAEQARQKNAEASRQAQMTGLREQLELSRMISSDLEAENELRKMGVERTSEQGKEIVRLVEATRANRVAVAGIESAFDAMFSEVDNGLKGMVRAFGRSILAMIAELASNRLKNALLAQLSVSGGGGGGGGGLFGSFIDGLVGAFAGAGGAAPTGGGGGASYGGGRVIHTAGGGRTKGLTWVGEEGPELLALPGGSQVFNRRQMQFAGAAGGGSTAYAPTYNISITGAKSDSEMRAELMGAITRKTEADKREIFTRLHRNGFPRIR